MWSQKYHLQCVLAFLLGWPPSGTPAETRCRELLCFLTVLWPGCSVPLVPVGPHPEQQLSSWGPSSIPLGMR